MYVDRHGYTVFWPYTVCRPNTKTKISRTHTHFFWGMYQLETRCARKTTIKTTITTVTETSVTTIVTDTITTTKPTATTTTTTTTTETTTNVTKQAITKQVFR